MPYRMNEDISFCEVDGHLLFLDLKKDQYFQISQPLEDAFLSFIHGRSDAPSDIAPLVERGILTNAPPSDCCVPSVTIGPPARSAIEQAPQAAKALAASLPTVFAIVLSTRYQLKVGNLKTLLRTLTIYRGDRTARSTQGTSEAQLLQAAYDFQLARLCVPFETSCLLDSLAMTRFLAKRSIYANVVFAVTTNPFSAHCWAQAGDLVLNDTVGNASNHTPIRIV